MKIFGAKACIHITHTGDLQTLATNLASGLMLPSFEIGPRESSPHDVMGSVETLGWELWLERTDSMQSFQYQLRMETTHSLEESLKGQMYDLSPWLARYVSSICQLEALVCGTQTVFRRGELQNLT